MRFLVVVTLALAGTALSLTAAAALPGVVELAGPIDAIPDAAVQALLGPAATDADVIALGESAHGSAGFLAVQARLIRHLVERRGIRLVVWETGVLRSLAMTRWLEGCTREITSPPLDVLYMPTQEDQPLFDWLCEFNRAHPRDPVRFRGMDVWDRPWEHRQRLLASGSRIGVASALLDTATRRCPASSEDRWPAFERVLDDAQAAGGFQPREAYLECRAALAAIVEEGRRFSAVRGGSGEGAAEEALELALSASTLLGWFDFYDRVATDDVGSWNARDEAQGRNLDLIMLRHGAARVVLAAHTSHVAHGRSTADWWGYGDLKSGVHFFARASGRHVFNVAFTGYDVAGRQGHWTSPTAVDSIDRALQAAGHRLAFFTAQASFLSKHRRWWMQNGNVPGKYENGVSIVPADQFDAYVFVSRSPAGRPLPAPDLWRP